jgi:hypothetical protein
MHGRPHRRAFLTSSLSVLGSYVLPSNIFGYSQSAWACAPASQVISVGSGVAVPSNFLGMHFHYWPHCYESGNIIVPAPTLSPTPNFSYGAWRSHDYYGGFNGNAANNVTVFQWANFHTSAGETTNAEIWASTNSAWAELDSVIQLHNSLGHDIYFTVYGTPNWAAKPGYNVGGLGSSSPPQNLDDLSNFIGALVTRYNTTAVFSNPMPIRYLEVWNEPLPRNNSIVSFSGAVLTWQFTESAGYSGAGLPLSVGDLVFFTSTGTLPNGISAGTAYYVITVSGALFTISTTSGGIAISLSGGSGALTAHVAECFFWGSSSDMAAMARTIYQAAKAVDPNIIVASPAFTGDLDPNDNAISQFLLASDGAGGNGKDWVDVLACHPYDTTVDTSTSSFPNLFYTIGQVRSLAASAGLPDATPWLISEQGWTSDDRYMNADTESNQALKLARHAIVSAAMGAQKHIFYVYDENYLGLPMLMNSSIKQSVLNSVNQNICGQTIVQCQINIDSTVTVVLGNGQSYCV